MNRSVTTLPIMVKPVTNKTWVIAEKEVKDALRNNIFLALLLLLAGLIIVSIIRAYACVKAEQGHVQGSGYPNQHVYEDF